MLSLVKLGKHYGGPTWESDDGSKVVGQVLEKVDSGEPSAIPWLLLAAKSSSGSGVFERVKNIQRLNTAGGKAPSAASCSRDVAGAEARVPYQATYVFFAAKP